MTFLSGFFMVNFLPWGLIALSGIVLFFSGNYKQKKWYYPLLFIVIVLTVISFWRIPVAGISRRYVMPTLVPGIVICTFVLMLLPKIFGKFKVPYANAVTVVMIAVLLIACAAKALRTQEKKEYLYDIPEAISLDCQKNNINKNVVLLVFGNPGGRLELNDNVDVINIENRHFNDRLADVAYQFAFLGRITPDETTNPDVLKIRYPDILKIRYPYLYILSVENQAGSLSNAWDKKYRDKLALLYEYIRPKDQIAYRLYRLRSSYLSAWLSTDEFEKILRANNVLPNGDFKKKLRVPPDGSIAQVLRKCGVVPAGDSEFYLPEGWMIDPAHGWKAACKPVSIKLPGDLTDALNIQSKDWVTLHTMDTLDGNKTYLFAIDASAGPEGGKLSLVSYVYTSDMKYVKTTGYHDISLSNQHRRQLIPFRLENCEKFRLSLLFSGNVNVKSIMAIPEETATK